MRSSCCHSCRWRPCPWSSRSRPYSSRPLPDHPRLHSNCGTCLYKYHCPLQILTQAWSSLRESAILYIQRRTFTAAAEVVDACPNEWQSTGNRSFRACLRRRKGLLTKRAQSTTGECSTATDRPEEDWSPPTSTLALGSEYTVGRGGAKSSPFRHCELAEDPCAWRRDPQRETYP